MNNIHKWRALCRAEFSQHGGSLYTAPPFWVRAIVKGDVIHVQSWGKYAGPVRRPRPQQLNRVFEEFKKGNILLPTDTPTRELHRLQLARCVEHPDGRQCWTFPRGGLHPIYAVFAHIVGD